MATLNHPKAETAHILFLDAVGYSTLPLDRQTAVFRGLQDIVNNSPTVADAASRNEVIRNTYRRRHGAGLLRSLIERDPLCPGAGGTDRRRLRRADGTSHRPSRAPARRQWQHEREW